MSKTQLKQPSSRAILTVLARFALSIPVHIFAALWPLIFHGSPFALGLSVPLLIYGLGGPSDLEQLSGFGFVGVVVTMMLYAMLDSLLDVDDTKLTSVLRDAIRDRAMTVDTQRAQAKTAEAGALSLTSSKN